MMRIYLEGIFTCFLEVSRPRTYDDSVGSPFTRTAADSEISIFRVLLEAADSQNKEIGKRG